jgi:2,4-dienoyl-CoA reductase-like NADH-dependent reductase (Old Yellow Enzyme family)
MVSGKADTEGRVTDDLIRHYVARARAGTALIIVEATAVDARGRVWGRGLGAWSDDHETGLARLAAAVKAEGAVAGIQLVHGGPQGNLDIPGNDRVGPSEVDPPQGGPRPRALSLEEIAALPTIFADAAARVVAAGFHLVEVHGAHDYLLDSFLTTQTNKRTDEYGGDIAGRMRLMVATCRAVKGRIADTALLDCRISIFNKEGGEFGGEDFQQLVSALEQAGIGILHISTDGAFKPYFDSEKTIGRWAKEITSLPLIVAGGLGKPTDAERAVAEGHTDLAAIGNAMYEDGDWTALARETLRT